MKLMLILILKLRVVFLFSGGPGVHARRQAHTHKAVVSAYVVSI